MDLLQSVRKEGSRGGANFSWDDVKSDQHRENYLGHSLMAPVGRWQKNKDLSWYAKSDADKLSEAALRKEEIKRLKEAEEDALARALGYDVPIRKGGANANEIPLGERKMETNDAIPSVEVVKAVEEKSRHGDKREKRSHRRSRSRSRNGDERRRHDRSRDGEHRHRHSHHRRSRSRSRVRGALRDGSRERRYKSPERRRQHDSGSRREGDFEHGRSYHDRRRHRSRSPYESRGTRDGRVSREHQNRRP